MSQQFNATGQKSLFTEKNTCRQPEGLTPINAGAHSNNTPFKHIKIKIKIKNVRIEIFTDIRQKLRAAIICRHQFGAVSKNIHP